MENPVTVKWFTSAMSGAPTLYGGSAGAMVGVFDAVCVNGFGSVTLSSLTVSSQVATATVNTGHGFLDHAVVLVNGASPSALNGDKRITRTSSTQFTFDATGIADQNVTGPITAKMSPVSWNIDYTDTNKRVYRRLLPKSTRQVLRVDDTASLHAYCTCYDYCKDINGTNSYNPISYYIGRGAYGNNLKNWCIISDGYMIYWILCGNDYAPNTYDVMGCWGDIVPWKSNDFSNCYFLGCYNGSGNFNDGNRLVSLNHNSGYFARSYSQIGTAVSSYRYSNRLTTAAIGAGGTLPYPNPATNGFHAWPVDVWEGTTVIRGIMPGLYSPLHPPASFNHGDVISSVSGFTGRKFVIWQCTSNYRVCFDLTGPWRL